MYLSVHILSGVEKLRTEGTSSIVPYLQGSFSAVALAQPYEVRPRFDIDNQLATLTQSSPTQAQYGSRALAIAPQRSKYQNRKSRKPPRRKVEDMGKAEVGSNKWVANKMKSKGLQRLRWWCEICQKQCRDANGFKCHVQSESHVRQMQVVGEDPRKFINQFSTDFQRDFVALLRTAHGEKWISSNKFYNEYIRDKEHVHVSDLARKLERDGADSSR